MSVAEPQVKGLELAVERDKTWEKGDAPERMSGQGMRNLPREGGRNTWSIRTIWG
jgi:hypothetical protein